MDSNNSINVNGGNLNGAVQGNYGNITNNFFGERKPFSEEGSIVRAKRLCNEGFDFIDNDKSKALERFHEAASIYEKLPDAHFGIGLIHFQSKEYRLALASFLTAKELYEDSEFAKFQEERKVVDKLIIRAHSRLSRPPFLRW
jgi:hypothetical protein